MLLLLLGPVSLRGDAIMVSQAMQSTTIAELFVTNHAVRVELEIGLPDLEVFANLLPEELYRDVKGEGPPGEQRLEQFFQDDWQIRNEKGESLSGTLLKIEPRRRVLRDATTGDPVPDSNATQEMVVFAELEFPFESRPDQLSIVPPGAGDPDRSGAQIGFVTHHLGVRVNDWNYLNQSVELNLDWTDPWYSQFRKRGLRRFYADPLSVYVYLDPFEVRKEVILRAYELQYWTNAGLDEVELISPEQQPQLKQQALEFLSAHGEVTIDGRPVAPRDGRAAFIERSLDQTSRLMDGKPLPVHSAFMAVTFTYPVMELPGEMSMTWDLFHDKLRTVPAAAVDEGGGMPYILRPGSNVLRWKNFQTDSQRAAPSEIPAPPEERVWQVPVLSLCALLVAAACVVARMRRPAQRRPLTAMMAMLLFLAVFLAGVRVPVPKPGGAIDMEGLPEREIVQGLLRNVYLAFGHSEEERTYDRLAGNVSGDLLTQLYLQVRQSLEVRNQGGARVKIKEVELESISTRPVSGEPAFLADCTWTAQGSVGHWGHIHQRRNRFQAELRIEAVEGRWKITGLNLESEERVDAAPGS